MLRRAGGKSWSNNTRGRGGWLGRWAESAKKFLYSRRVCAPVRGSGPSGKSMMSLSAHRERSCMLGGGRSVYVNDYGEGDFDNHLSLRDSVGSDKQGVGSVSGWPKKSESGRASVSGFGHLHNLRLRVNGVIIRSLFR